MKAPTGSTGVLEDNRMFEDTVLETTRMQIRIAELEMLELRLMRSRKALQELMDSTSSCVGTEFLKALVSKLASVLNVRYAYVTECIDRRKTKVRILAMWMGTDYGKTVEYTVAEKPCVRAISGETCVFPKGLLELFPNNRALIEWNAQSFIGVPLFHSDGSVIGHLAVLDDKPLDDEKTMTEILKIFAHRAEAEIQRRHSEKRLQQKKEELENVTRIVSSINVELTVAGVLQAVLNGIRSIDGVEKATAILLDNDSRTYKLIASTDGHLLPSEKNIELTPDEAFFRYVKGNEEIYPDIFLVRPIQGRAAEEKLAHLGMPRSLMAMRITIENLVEGYIVMDNLNEENAFDHHDIGLIHSLREHVISALIKIRMMEKLTRLNEKKNEFVGFAAHDLRNPLQCVIGYASMMLDDICREQVNMQEFRSDLQYIQKAATRMMDFVNDLLNISSIESGHFKMELTPLTLNDILSDNLEFHRRAAEKKNIQLVVEESKLPATPVDRNSIAQVIDNLLSNAIKYTYSGGRVRVHFEVTDNEIVTHVSDTGQGLDKADLNDVFSGCRKLNSKPTGGESSTGLGLAIVRKIVERHGGRLSVQSERNCGSTFTFALPRSQSGPTRD